MQFLSYLINGISLGSVYALIALGYTMVYGILRLINFAHGDVFMVAGLLGIYVSAVLPIYVAIPVVIILTVALGFFIERAAYKPLRSQPCYVCSAQRISSGDANDECRNSVARYAEPCAKRRKRVCREL